jgi:hypothetical protein
MRRALDLDDHARLEAGEVGDEAAENNLATKAEARYLMASDALPQAALGACRIASEASRESLGMARPPTLTRPHKGGEGRLSALGRRYSTVTCVLTELAMKQISWASWCRRSSASFCGAAPAHSIVGCSFTLVTANLLGAISSVVPSARSS